MSFVVCRRTALFAKIIWLALANRECKLPTPRHLTIAVSRFS
jgi:hypothetical protein